MVVVPAETKGVSSGLLSAEHRLDNPANDPAWRPLFEKLAPHRTRQSNFEERRYFPFRREPVVFRGEIRIVPDRGLSLRYLEPEPQVMIVDDKGLLMRGADGRERTAPTDSRAQAATSALVSVLRFNVAALQQEFAMYGQRAGETWMLAFVPRDAAVSALLGTILVSGEATTLARIEMIKSPTQRIEINVSDTREGVLFTGDTLRRYFR
jgi:outer membrane lipoprotein-sorting protein